MDHHQLRDTPRGIRMIYCFFFGQSLCRLATQVMSTVVKFSMESGQRLDGAKQTFVFNLYYRLFVFVFVFANAVLYLIFCLNAKLHFTIITTSGNVEHCSYYALLKIDASETHLQNITKMESCRMESQIVEHSKDGCQVVATAR